MSRLSLTFPLSPAWGGFVDQSTWSSSKRNRYNLLAEELATALGKQILGNSVVSERNQPYPASFQRRTTQLERSILTALGFGISDCETVFTEYSFNQAHAESLVSAITCSSSKSSSEIDGSAPTEGSFTPSAMRAAAGSGRPIRCRCGNPLWDTNSIRLSMLDIGRSGSLYVAEHYDFATPVVASLSSLFSAVAVTIVRTSLGAARASQVASYAVSALAGVGAAPVLDSAGFKRLRNESLGPSEQVEAHKRQQIALTWGRSAAGGRPGLPVRRNNPSSRPVRRGNPRVAARTRRGPRPALRMVTRPTTAMEANNQPHCGSGPQSQGFDEDDGPSPSPEKRSRARGSTK
ncbi:hypothetical protein DL768_001505 [Monosporascus sp. mg162]|nr:hypothetical protein DL768_001505 [Monosporascus sp. mg162]